VDPLPHVALTVGGVGAPGPDGRGVEQGEPTLVRMHRRDLLGDIFLDEDSSPEGATGDVLRASLRAIQQEGRGAVVYLRPEGIGDGLNQRLLAIRRAARDSGAEAPDLMHPYGVARAVEESAPAHQREFGIGSQILRDLGVRELRLLTNHATEHPGLEAFGLRIVERVSVPIRRP
jgi:3,4-dihydroxy 2-butanone 4-phosphate synthase/GTP cyclohydrolase II